MAHDLIHDNLDYDCMNKILSFIQMGRFHALAWLQLGNWTRKGVGTAEIWARKQLAECTVDVTCLWFLAISSSDSEMDRKMVEN